MKEYDGVYGKSRFALLGAPDVISILRGGVEDGRVHLDRNAWNRTE